jgi:hypothetical protein
VISGAQVGDAPLCPDRIRQHRRFAVSNGFTADRARMAVASSVLHAVQYHKLGLGGLHTGRAGRIRSPTPVRTSNATPAQISAGDRNASDRGARGRFNA